MIFDESTMKPVLEQHKTKHPQDKELCKQKRRKNNRTKDNSFKKTRRDTNRTS
jgi:hypothetical protein